jgi:hypothetical protein
VAEEEIEKAVEAAICSIESDCILRATRAHVLNRRFGACIRSLVASARREAIEECKQIAHTFRRSKSGFYTQGDEMAGAIEGALRALLDNKE